jgi:RsiW-degrading membrane proteinase PrsW (M82 family)
MSGEHMTTEKKNEIFSAIAVSVLLIGSASGSAITMLVLSALTLTCGVLFFRSNINSSPIRILIVAAVTGIIIALTISFVSR